MVKNNQGKIFQIGIIVGVVLFLLSSVENWLSSCLYIGSDPILWNQMIGNWWLYILIYNLIVGLIFVLVYGIFYSAIPDKGASRGIQFGFWIWLIGIVPSLIITWLTIAVPGELIVVWFITGLLNYAIIGLIIGSLYKPEK